MKANDAGRGTIPNFKDRLTNDLKQKTPKCLLHPERTTDCREEMPLENGQSKCGLCKRRAGM